MLLDWVGSAKMDDALVEELKSAGVEVLKYHPPHWSHLGRLNNRTHRKLLVVDGRVGFTGGVGIAEKWTGNAQDPGPLARHPLPGRGAGGRADAGGLHRQLDQVDRHACCTAPTTSRILAARRQGRGPDVQQLAQRRQREHGDDVR